jgi:hypothetical protein
MTTQDPASELTLSHDAQRLLFHEARTANAFTDEPVTDEQIRAIYELVKWAPTAANTQPLRLVVVRSPEAKERLLPLMAEGNRDKTAAAPVTVILAAVLSPATSSWASAPPASPPGRWPGSTTPASTRSSSPGAPSGRSSWSTSADPPTTRGSSGSPAWSTTRSSPASDPGPTHAPRSVPARREPGGPRRGPSTPSPWGPAA